MNYDGEVNLVIEKRNGRVITSKRSFNGVLKVSKTIHLDREDIPTYFLMQVGGGFVEGEKYITNIELKSKARSIITTQASTKVYKCENNIETYQESNIILLEESVLEFINDPVILYKDAIYKQTNTVHMKESSTFIYIDGITSGWSPDRKKFQYRKAHLKMKIYIEDELYLLDNLLMEPRKEKMIGLGILEGYLNFGTLIVIDRRID